MFFNYQTKQREVNLRKLLILISLLLMTTISCEKDATATEENSIAQDQSLKMYLMSLGYPESDIVDHEKYIVLQEDIMIDKPNSLQSRSKQNYWDFRISRKNYAKNVKIYFPDPNITDEEHWHYTFWSNALNSAISEWNSVPNKILTLTRVYSSNGAHITIEPDTKPNHGQLLPTTPAMGDHPDINIMNGAPGDLILLNVDFNYPGWGQSNRIWTLVHEIGHNVGIPHANEDVNVLPYITHVPGTPTYTDGLPNSGDPNSVFKGGALAEIGYTITDFTSHDITTIQYLFPELDGSIDGPNWVVPADYGTPAVTKSWDAEGTGGIADNQSHYTFKWYKVGSSTLLHTGSTYEEDFPYQSYQSSFTLKLVVSDENDSVTIYKPVTVYAGEIPGGGGKGGGGGGGGGGEH